MSASSSRWFVLGCLLLTVGLGAALRWALAGVPLLPGDFANLRHVHTHAGYYGVLFPLMWWAWAQRGEPTPGRLALGVYAVATLASLVGFAREGYGLLSIAGSTVVLGVWLHSAWRLRHACGPDGGWLATASIGVALSAACIPLVAASADGDRAVEIVRTFLGMLLFTALIPSALHVLRAPGTAGPLWLLAAVAGAISLGAVPHPALRAGLVVVAALLARAAWRAPAMSGDLRALWLALAAGLAAVGAGLLPLTRGAAVAGVHFALLGPLLMTLARPLWPAPLPRVARAAYAAALLGMCGGILLQDLRFHPLLPTVSAAGGSALAALWAAGLLWRWATSHRPWANAPRG